MTKYEIFANAATAAPFDGRINALFGYPNGAQRYRTDWKHPGEGDDRVACPVGDDLVAICEPMTPEERANYYNPDALQSLEQITAEGWTTLF